MEMLGDPMTRYLPAGYLAATESGGYLRFQAPDGRDVAEVKVTVGVEAAVVGSDDCSRWLKVRSTFTDCHGDLWQVEELISAYELFDRVLRKPVFAHANDLFPEDASTSKASWDQTQVRTLAKGIHLEADTRETRPVFVWRRRPDSPDEDQQYETLVFAVREKYFSADLDVVEFTRIRSSPQPCCLRSVHLLIRPFVKTRTGTAMDHKRNPIAIEPVDFDKLAPLSGQMHLPSLLWTSGCSLVKSGNRAEVCCYKPPLARFQRTSERGAPNAAVSFTVD